MDSILSILVLCSILNWPAFVDSSVADSYLVKVENVEFSGLERFPEKVDVALVDQGNQIYLQLKRDDQSTNILSEELFEASKFLPSGVFNDDNRDSFAAYVAGPSDMIVLQRESTDDKPRFGFVRLYFDSSIKPDEYKVYVKYGRFTDKNEKLLIQPESESSGHHRLRREVKNEHTRVRRDVSDENVLELFVFADLSVFEQIRDEFMPVDATTKQIKKFIKGYINGVTKEVDSIYKKLGEDYGANNTFRVYFQQYQIITEAKQQGWVTDNLSNNKLGSNTPVDLQTYYKSLIDKFAFPSTDAIVHLTRLPLIQDYDVLYTWDQICGANIFSFTSRIENYPTSIAKGIAFGFSVVVDGNGNNCTADDQYIMSSQSPDTNANSTNQGNRWKFSKCSAEKFNEKLSTEPACLKTQDVIYDLELFDNSPTITDLLSLDQQCQILFDRNSTICSADTIDCYSSTQGCNVSGMCNSIEVPQGTPCNTANNAVCEYGFCVSEKGNSSSTSTDVQTTTVTPSTSTGTPSNCVVETGFVEFDLPGCGCCGGCGCDNTCSSCDPGLPAYNQSESCTKDASCCGSKVRMTTLFVPDGCELTYVQGPRTLVMEKRGWENTDAEVTAEVYQDASERWQVNLVPTS